MQANAGESSSGHRPSPDRATFAATDIAEECDGLHYDAKSRLLYLSCGVGVLDVVRQLDADHYERVERMPTSKGAATSLYVPELDRLYLAVPAHGAVPAELRIYRPSARKS